MIIRHTALFLGKSRRHLRAKLRSTPPRSSFTGQHKSDFEIARLRRNLAAEIDLIPQAFVKEIRAEFDRRIQKTNLHREAPFAFDDKDHQRRDDRRTQAPTQRLDYAPALLFHSVRP